MNYSQYRFTLDLQKHQSQMSISVFKHDTAVRLYIGLTDGGKPYYIKDGNTAIFYGKRADEKELVHRCMIKSNTEIVYEFDPNGSTTYVDGIVQCQLRLYGTNGELISAPRFVIVVDERLVNDDDVNLDGKPISALDEIFLNEQNREDRMKAMEDGLDSRFDDVHDKIAVLESMKVWDYDITTPEELTNENLATMSGNVHVKGVTASDLDITVPKAIKYIRFTDCSCQGKITAEETGVTKIAGISKPGEGYSLTDRLILEGFKGVEDCTGVYLINCQNVERCSIVCAATCDFLDTIGVYTHGSVIFHECNHIKNVSKIGGDNPITYDNCNIVDGDSCEDYYASNAGKVRFTTADGSERLENVYTQAETDSLFGKWDYVITDLSQFDDFRNSLEGNVLITGVTFNKTANITIVSAVETLVFKDCTFTINSKITFDTGTVNSMTVLGAVVSEGYAKFVNFYEVADCHGSIDIENSALVHDCTIKRTGYNEGSIKSCTCVRDIYLPTTAKIDSCKSVSNIYLAYYGTRSEYRLYITNCNHVSNITTDPTTLGKIYYSGCTHVVGNTCFGYYQEQDAGKVHSIAEDGTDKLIPVYTQEETDEKIRELVAQLVNSAPETLDTLAELARALGDDSNFAVSVNTALSNRYTKQESDERYVKVDDLGGGSSDYENLVGKVGEIESQIGDISTILTALHEGGI